MFYTDVDIEMIEIENAARLSDAATRNATVAWTTELAEDATAVTARALWSGYNGFDNFTEFCADHGLDPSAPEGIAAHWAAVERYSDWERIERR